MGRTCLAGVYGISSLVYTLRPFTGRAATWAEGASARAHNSAGTGKMIDATQFHDASVVHNTPN